MKKQIMSIAAAAAILTTGAMAFDAAQGTGQLLKEKASGTGVYVGQYTDATQSALPTELNSSKPGAPGDALIYPTFYSKSGWETEFSVINNSSTNAVVAKVVLYSAIDSKELRDFNIYLSANDVFRATIKDGNLHSTDGSTVSANQWRKQTNLQHFEYIDTSVVMVSEDNPLDVDVSEDIGYIAVYGMAQAGEASKNGATAAYENYPQYHKKHTELVSDYNHLLDQCRGTGWRSISNIREGIYTKSSANISSPNSDLDLPPVDTVITASPACGTLGDTVLNAKGSELGNDINMTFTGVDAVLTGSVLLKASDSKGTRSLLLNATPLVNFTDEDNSSMLWTGGELASIADRCIDKNGTLPTDISFYDAACVAADANSTFDINTANYEFRASKESLFALTQPYKRTIIQMDDETSTSLTALNVWKDNGVERSTIKVTNVENNTSNGTNGGEEYSVTNYGAFLVSSVVYNDDEDLFIGQSSGFIFSPAGGTDALGIPNEMVMWNPLQDTIPYTRGYAVLSFDAGQHGIATQMAADTVGDTVETNWIYPHTTRD